MYENYTAGDDQFDAPLPGEAGSLAMEYGTDLDVELDVDLEADLDGDLDGDLDLEHDADELLDSAGPQRLIGMGRRPCAGAGGQRHLAR